MKSIHTFNSFFTNEARKKFYDYPYELHYSLHGIRSADGGNTPEELIKRAKDRKIKEFSIFKNASGFHSTAQEEFLVHWYDEKNDGYWSERSKKEPDLLKKKLETLE